jgi:hypothetical protein
MKYYDASEETVPHGRRIPLEIGNRCGDKFIEVALQVFHFFPPR